MQPITLVRANFDVTVQEQAVSRKEKQDPCLAISKGRTELINAVKTH